MDSKKTLENLAAEYLRMDKRAVSRDFQRRLQMEKVESEVEAKIKTRDESIVGKDNLETQINMEMIRLKIEEQNDAKLRHRLWENNPEIKELKRKLQHKYVSKQLEAQINEKKKIANEEKLHLKKFDEFINTNLALAKEYEQKELEEANTKKLRYKEDLLNQIANSSKKQDASKEFLRDKAMLELNLQSLEEEVKKEKEININKLNKFRKDIEQEQILQHEYLEGKKQALDDEERRIKHYIYQQELNKNHKLEKIKETEQLRRLREEVLYNMRMFDNGHEKEEKKEILHYLQEERLKETYMTKEKEELEKSVRWREEVKKIVEQQYQEKMKSIEENNVQEMEYRRQMEAEATKGEQIAQIELEKKRQSIVNYRNQLKEQLEEKHRRQVECWQQEILLQKLSEAEDMKIKKIVEEECLKLHVPT